MEMDEYIAITNQQDIERFIDETNGLHDGYIIGVEYRNEGISSVPGGHSFDPTRTSLRLRVLVTSMWDAVVELLFENIQQWQIRDEQWDMTDISLSVDEKGWITWADDYSTAPEIRVKGSYVVARSMKWRIME